MDVRLLCILVSVLSGCASAVEYEPKATPSAPVYDARAEKKLIARGQYLVDIAACGVCHGGPDGLSGGKMISIVGNDDVAAANITADGATGIGSWSVAAISHSLQSEQRKDGTQLAPGVHRAYRWMADEDRLAISFALLASAPVANSVPRSKRGSRSERREGYVPQVQPAPDAAYGRYLVHHVMGCASCHSDEDPAYVRELSFSGRERDVGAEVSIGGPALSFFSGGWSVKTISEYLQSGTTPSGGQVKDCPQQYFSKLRRSDRVAAAQYLATR